jgi:hypothetical protein
MKNINQITTEDESALISLLIEEIQSRKEKGQELPRKGELIKTAMEVADITTFLAIGIYNKMVSIYKETIRSMGLSRVYQRGY